MSLLCAPPPPLPAPSPALFSEANIECGQWMYEEEGKRAYNTLRLGSRPGNVSEANIPSVIPHLSSQQA